MLEATSCRVSELSEELTKCNEKLHMAGSLGMNLLEDKRKLQEEMTDLKSRYSKLLEVQLVYVREKCTLKRAVHAFIGFREGEIRFAAEAVGSEEREGLQNCRAGIRNKRVATVAERV